MPCTPLNYRLSATALQTLLDRLPEPLVIVDAEYRDVVRIGGGCVIDSGDFVMAAETAAPFSASPDGDEAAVVLFTSGTTSRPRPVELSHINLTSYITAAVEFSSSESDDAALIAVPPHHIAGVSAALSNLYTGRRTVYLRRFDAAEWVRAVRDESVTTATVVPTMLERIVPVLKGQPNSLPTLRNLAYGGSKAPQPLIRQALDLLPNVGFVNANGLTETSSTIAMLTPADHRTAHRATNPMVAPTA